MVRILLSLLLIINLLACPYHCLMGRCMVDECCTEDCGEEGTTATVWSKDCGCCQEIATSELGSGSTGCDQDSAPLHQCSCENCFCDGALLENAFQASTTDLEQALCFDLWQLHEISQQRLATGKNPGGSSTLYYASRPANLSAPTGRTARIVLQSWQL